MSEQMIGQGEGNLVPDTKAKKYLLSEAAIVGDWVVLVGTTGYTVELSDAADEFIVGVVKVAGAAGDWVEVIVGGYCAVASCDSGTTAGEFLDSGTTAGEALGTATLTVFSGGLAISAAASGFCTCLVFDRFGS